MQNCITPPQKILSGSFSGNNILLLTREVPDKKTEVKTTEYLLGKLEWNNKHPGLVSVSRI